MLKPAFFARLAAATLALSAALPAHAATDESGATAAASLIQAAAAMKPNAYRWEADDAAGPVAVVVSLADQRAYVFRGQSLVAVSTVSTGKAGKETPVGVFTILQKKAFHRSNLYNNAPMPFMQRLIWDGIALHAGHNPGAPASHGCVRLPAEFAKKLFAATEMGAVVQVTDMPFDASMPAPVSDADAVAEANRMASRPATLDTFLASR